MCLIIAAVFLGLAVTAGGKGDWLLMSLYATIAIAFLLLMARNIKKAREERKNTQDESR